jgi:beta-glucanase (GH16 family)
MPHRHCHLSGRRRVLEILMTTKALLLALLCGLALDEGRGADSPSAARGALVWSDEFDGAAIDRQKWNFDTGNGFKAEEGMWISGWGNNELQFYTTRATNAFVQDGRLHVRALKEEFYGCRYTSARLVTRGCFDRRYGRIEFRARLPAGQGLWPALWMLPADNAYGSWAASGEIDVMEARGQELTKVLGTIHYGARWPANEHAGGEYRFSTGSDITGFHTYAVEWRTNAIHWYVDDQRYATRTNWWSSSKVDGQLRGLRPQGNQDLNPWPAPFDRPFYLIINLAVGGEFVGAPVADTRFPAEVVVDYVRVYDLPAD